MPDPHPHTAFVVLAEHVTRYRLFATEPAGGADQVVFDTNDEPVATATFR